MRTHRVLAWMMVLFLGGIPGLRAQFLDFSQPARSTALGGNLVALPEGSSAMVFNPAGLSLQGHYLASARYESLFSGLENDDISTGNLTFLLPAEDWGSLGASWDHLGSDQVQQDRMRVGWGRAFPVGGFLSSASAGFSLSYMSQRYGLTSPLSGVSLSGLSANAFGFGGGILLSLPLHLTFGLSADDLNRPNLGLVGSNIVPVLLRWGLSAPFLSQDSIRLRATLAQSLSDDLLDTQGGVECDLPQYGLHLRGGLGSYQGSVGFGYEVADLFLDYAYSFSINAGSQVAGTGLPGSHLVELGLKWGAIADAFEEDLKRAQDAESQGNWSQALRAYQEGLALKPEDPAALEGRRKSLARLNLQRAESFYQDGLKAEKRGAMAETRDLYEMAVNLAPDSGEYARALQRAGGTRADESVNATEEDLKVAAAIQQASQWVSKGNFKAATQVLNETLKKYPNQPALEMVLADLSPIPGKEEKGRPSSSAPDARLLSAESDLYLSKGRPDLAKKNLEEALKAQPQNLQIRQKLMRLEVATQAVPPARQKQAQELYEKGLKKYLDGDLNGAIEAWEGALKADPNHMKAQNNLVRAKLEKEAKP